MAAYEELYRGKCGCDTAACDVHELESVKEYIGPLCCNPDFVDVSSLLANDDCTDVQSMDFMEFLASMDEDDGALNEGARWSEAADGLSDCGTDDMPPTLIGTDVDILNPDFAARNKA